VKNYFKEHINQNKRTDTYEQNNTNSKTSSTTTKAQFQGQIIKEVGKVIPNYVSSFCSNYEFL
jgi:hypothetical protein